MALQLFQSTLPRYIVRRPVEQLAQRELLTSTRAQLAKLREMLGRNEYTPVVGRGAAKQRLKPHPANRRLSLKAIARRAFVSLKPTVGS